MMSHCRSVDTERLSLWGANVAGTTGIARQTGSWPQLIGGQGEPFGFALECKQDKFDSGVKVKGTGIENDVV